MNDHKENDQEHIAIIGMAGRFPGAATIEQFWQNLKNGKNCVSQFTDEELAERGVNEEVYTDPNYVKAGVVLENIDLFDADFFGYNAKEAETMDPQQRIFMELAWEALESAGCDPATYDGAIGVFGGTSPSDYVKRIPASQDSITSGFDSFQAMMGNDVDFLTTRVAYKLDLTGPSFTLQTACSTSLVAVHIACQHLLTYQCDVAIAGGVSIRLPQGVGYTYRDGMIWSPDGFCRAFDAQAQGTIFGRGAGIVVLKRLSEAIEDRDHIHAVIKGSAVNNDGALKVGFTAPSVEGQSEVISIAQALANTPPETINYIEAHGTGTKLGDPIEIEALTKAFRTGTDKTQYCAIGSIKTNIGHLDVAAGIAGLIKTTLALQHREIPPSLHFEQPNPNINFSDTPFYVVSESQPWNNKELPRRAGVSSFGIGGTNAHVVLEEAPQESAESPTRSSQLLTLSAKSQSALQDYSSLLANYFRNNSNISLANAAYTLHTGRKHFEHRRILVCQDIDQAIESLSETDINHISPSGLGNEGIVFMFSGQGSQHINMCKGLYEEEPFFKKQVDHCSEILLEHLECDLREILFPSDTTKETKELINQTNITQPALFVIEYSLAKLLMDWGITPKAMVGHSIGEYVAACLAGVFSLSDALALVVARGRMMYSLTPGSMLAVPLSEEEIIPLLPQELSIAVINAPQMTVVSGETTVIEAFNDKLFTGKDIECRRLHTSHAFHSSMMEPIVKEFTQLVGSINCNKPEISFVSNFSGTWITGEQATSAEYWANHLRQAVRFYSCITTLLENNFRKFVEVGPGQVLTQLTKQHPKAEGSLILPTTRRPIERKEDLPFLQSTLGQLWMAGSDVDWKAFYQNESRRKIPLPTYPFQRKKYWIGEPPPQKKSDNNNSAGLQPHSPELIVDSEDISEVCGPRNDLELQIASTFCELLGTTRIDVRDNFFDIGGDSLLAAKLLTKLEASCGGNLSLADIFENSSVEALAKLIKSGGGRLHTTTLPLNNGSSERLIYFVVGIHIYKELAQHLSATASCFGTFLPVEETLFSNDVDQNKWTISDLATAYREEIHKHSNGRPISLVGVSFGGAVAYELARQLDQIGQPVELLVMLDSLLPSGMHRDPFKWAVAQTQNVFKHGFSPTIKKLKTKLSARTKKFSPPPPKALPSDQDSPDQRQKTYADAVDRFEAAETKSTYAGKTLLICAQDEPRYPGYQVDSHLGWQKHIIGEFHVASAPGDHLGILKSPNVQSTADIIKRALNGNL